MLSFLLFAFLLQGCFSGSAVSIGSGANKNIQKHISVVVLGEVKNSGEYRLAYDDENPVTLTKALAKACPLKTGNIKDVQIKRKNADKKYEIYKFDFSDFLNTDKDDFKLEDQDIIFIKENVF